MIIIIIIIISLIHITSSMAYFNHPFYSEICRLLCWYSVLSLYDGDADADAGTGEDHAKRMQPKQKQPQQLENANIYGKNNK